MGRKIIAGLSVAAGLVTMAYALGPVLAQPVGNVEPFLTTIYGDPITGNNEYCPTTTCTSEIGNSGTGTHRWFVDSATAGNDGLADVYGQEAYERPIRSGSGLTNVAAPADVTGIGFGDDVNATQSYISNQDGYRGFEDIVQARAGADGGILYFEWVQYDRFLHESDGKLEQVNGGLTDYGIRISSSMQTVSGNLGGGNSGASGTLLKFDDISNQFVDSSGGTSGNDFDVAGGADWETTTMAGFTDTSNNSCNAADCLDNTTGAEIVGGAGGMADPNPDGGSVSGYDVQTIADGALNGNLGDSGTTLLWGRIDRQINNYNGLQPRNSGDQCGPGEATSNPAAECMVVQMAFDYQAWNDNITDNVGGGATCANASSSTANDPRCLFADKITHLVFESNSSNGNTGVSNYHWNDEDTFADAGSPYDTGNEPSQIKELDTLTAVGETCIAANTNCQTTSLDLLAQ